jgi:hypothetical protein
MLKHEGLRWGAVAVLAGLLVVPEAALAAGRAASTRSDGSVSSRGGSSGGSSGSSSSATASRASSGSSQSSGRVAVPRGSGGSERSGGTPAASGASGGAETPRVAVPRTTDEARRGPDRTHGRRPAGRDGRRVVIGGWWADPWFYAPHWGVWSSWWWPWGPAVYGGYGYGSYRDSERRGRGFGALDTDVWPEEAEVWVDGERVGTADDFDGFPSYLWLPEGTYDVVFYLPGYRTLARQYSIYRGVIIDVEDRLERGDAVHPNELQSTSTVHRDARLQRNREREEAARAREGWRERTDRRSAAVEAEDLPVEGAAGEVARLHLRVTPADASVYLDGNFFGTARELEQLSAGLVLAPGSHRLQVVRPGFRSEEVVFDSDPGEALELRVDLESE